MTTLLEISIPGEPVGKGRPRVVHGGTHVFTPERTARWEGFAAMMARSAWGGRKVDAPLALLVRAVKARPQRMPRGTPSGRVWRPRRPDGDNVLKAVADSLMLAGVVRDDASFVDKRVLSFYAALGEGPCVEIVVSLPGDPEA